MRATALDEYQKRAATNDCAKLCIIAGAGAGKTRCLSARVSHLVRGGIKPNNLLCATFTRKAAQGMSERVIAELGELHGREVEIGTIHSIALKLLRRHGERIGYRPDKPGQRITVCDEEEQTEFLAIARNLSMSQKIRKRDIDECFWHYNSRADCEEQVKANAAVARLWNTYRRLLVENNCVDFGGIIAGAVRLMTEHESIRLEYHERWKYVLLDEAHDSNPAQWKFLNLINPENLFVVLDFRQAIYGWNGADSSIVRGMIGNASEGPDATIWE